MTCIKVTKGSGNLWCSSFGMRLSPLRRCQIFAHGTRAPLLNLEMHDHGKQ
jgi:hypothetical protein